MRKVMIIGDSTCDLPPEWREKLNVGFMPLPVNVGIEPRLDMFDVFPEEIFDYFKRTGTLCTTSAPNALDYIEFWTKVREQDPDCDILHFHISSAMTITHAACVEATQEFENVWSIDTKSVSAGVAVLLLEACRLRDEGKSAQEIFDAVEAMKPRVKIGFVLDSVEFLYKGGRCTGLQAFGANLLGLHPFISMVDGVLAPGKKYRGNLKSVYKNLIADVLGNPAIKIENDRLFVANTSPDEETNAYLLETIRAVRPELKEIIFTQPGCSVSVHCGPNTVGLAFLLKE